MSSRALVGSTRDQMFVKNDAHKVQNAQLFRFGTGHGGQKNPENPPERRPAGGPSVTPSEPRRGLGGARVFSACVKPGGALPCFM